MEDLKTIEQFHQVKLKKVMFVFTANWCPDCSAIKPMMPQISAQHTEYMWLYVNRDHFSQLVRELNIYGIPSFIAFENGIELGRFVSKARKNKSEIEKFIMSLEKGGKQ
jgi:thioredoxin-like negative regulator of GroEL